MFFMWFTQPMGSDCDAALGSYDVPGGRCVCGVRAPEAAVGARGGPTKIFSFTFNIYNPSVRVSQITYTRNMTPNSTASV